MQAGVTNHLWNWNDIVHKIKKDTANNMELINTSFMETWVNVTNIAYIATLALTLILVGLNIYWSGRLSKAKDHNFNVYKAKNDSILIDARLKTEQIRNENMALQLELEKEKLRRLEVEKELKSGIQTTTEGLEETKQKLAPRIITEEQKKRFIEFFQNKTKLDINLFSIPNDEEAFQFSSALYKLFSSAGFSCEFKGYMMDPPAFNGVILYSPTETFPPVVMMQQMLNELDIRNIGHIDKNLSFNSIRIVVTKKPVD